ncbi:hypothetical protein [Actinomadura rubrisoli]|uniref:Uncharacterized protein n=1 Tax=Actinomadura rubrisoli TaxID=2530368 RepID=A0A4R5AX69_9ACTN|nr:hypothetical protein [Actinomadura rubrisoli]TDD77711.1 hypothetical protein E1298_29730 [Actinomadura rubrisoli]
MRHAILAKVRADVAELRDQASEHTRQATSLGEKLAEPGALLEGMARDEQRLMRDLEALRGEMLTVRHAYDAIAAERDHHLHAAQVAATVADGYEEAGRAAAALLEPVPPGEALAALGILRVPPKAVPSATEVSRWPCPKCGGDLRWVGEHFEEVGHAATGQEACPDELTAPGVIDSREQIAAATGGFPVVPPPVPTGPGVLAAIDAGDPLTTRTDPPEHPPGHRHARHTGPLQQVGLRKNRPQDDEQDGDDRG